MAQLPSTTPSAKPSMPYGPGRSVSRMTDSDLLAAVQPEQDKREVDALILTKANLVLSLGYDPGWDDRRRAEVLDAFRTTLRDLPLWALDHAFQTWIRTRPRRPTPAEIRILAYEAMEPIGREIASRKRAASPAPWEPKRDRVTAEAAERIRQELGFTDARTDLVKRFPLARSMEEVSETASGEHRSSPHWSETVAPDSREAEELQRARDANPLVKAARANLARQGGQGHE